MAKDKTLEAATAPINQPIERIYKGSGQIDHDAYKLEVATFDRNISWNDVPEYVGVEHAHFFHTIDSDGRTQTYSTPTGGHFHKMRVVPNPNGGPPTVTCDSGPLMMVKKKVKGKWTRVAEPTAGEDVHTHSVKYLKSDKIELRKVHANAVAIVTNDAQKGAPVPGIIG